MRHVLVLIAAAMTAYTTLAFSQQDDGPYRQKKTTIKQRTWEVHITSILKLDRAERVEETAPEQEQVEDPEVAP